jgi:hypothetical protein
MKAALCAIVAGAAFAFVGGAFAAGTDEFNKPDAREDADYMAGKAAIEAKNWRVAVDSFKRAARKFRDNPDVFN